MGLVGNTHLVRGGPDAVSSVLELLEREGMAVQGNPDVYVRTYRQFGIDEARELRERAGSRPIAGPHRVFIVATPGMTTEAQNALLKTLEEPPADAMFFFVVPAPETLLPTLRSRAQILWMSYIHTMDVAHPYIDKTIVDVNMFLAATPKNRLDMLKPLLEKDADDKRDLGAILGFLADLEKAFTAKTPRSGLRAVYRARKYITDKGALAKPLLEQIALLVPKV